MDRNRYLSEAMKKVTFLCNNYASKLETYICKSALLSSKLHQIDTPWSSCQQVNVPSDTCIRCLRRLRSFSQRSLCCVEYQASHMKVADVDRRSEGNQDYIRRHSKASFFRHPKQRSFVPHCSCSVGPCPMSALQRCHLLTRCIYSFVTLH